MCEPVMKAVKGSIYQGRATKQSACNAVTGAAVGIVTAALSQYRLVTMNRRGVQVATRRRSARAASFDQNFNTNLLPDSIGRDGG